MGSEGQGWIFGCGILVEGIALILFSQMTLLYLAIGTMILFSLFVQMAEGATFSVVPFVNKKAIGMISGIVGAGGNVGAVMAGFLLKMEGLSYSDALSILGITVAAISASSLLIRFSKVDEKVAQEELQASLDQKAALQPEMVNS